MKYLLACLLIPGTLHAQSGPRSAQEELIGTKLDRISITHYLLNEPSNKDYDGKFKVLEFWATWCRPCLAAVPHLNKVQESLKGEDIVFLSVTNEGPGKAATAFRRVKFETIVVSDTTFTLHRALRILYDDTMGLPRTVLLDRDNKILWYGSPHKLSRKFMLGFMKKED